MPDVQARASWVVGLSTGVPHGTLLDNPYRDPTVARGPQLYPTHFSFSLVLRPNGLPIFLPIFYSSSTHLIQIFYKCPLQALRQTRGSLRTFDWYANCIPVKLRVIQTHPHRTIHSTVHRHGDNPMDSHGFPGIRMDSDGFVRIPKDPHDYVRIPVDW